MDAESTPRPPMIGLVRVSTEKQADSGLGLDAQLAAIERHRARIRRRAARDLHEVESGMHADIQQPAPAQRRRRARRRGRCTPGHRQARPPGPVDLA